MITTSRTTQQQETTSKVSVTNLSIVIVSWNTKKYLEECLTSLRTIDGNLSVEIIVVDNDSADGTPDMIRSEFPDVKLIETGANLGFAKGNNVGIKEATGEYICLINSDVNVPSDCLQKMYEYMEQQPTIGLLGPGMLRTDGRVHRSGMRFPSLWNIFLRALFLDSLFKSTGLFGGFLMKDFHFDQTRDMDVLNGWLWMARRDALHKVGPLDGRFFMYAEDVDWCKRFKLAGWRVVFYPEAKALHYGGASAANARSRFNVEMQRANLQYWKKYHGRISLFLYLMIGCLSYAVRAVGWAAIFLVKKSSRSRANIEMKQYLKCIRWVFESSTLNELVKQ
ncbi:MAG TPA: glycosyltransferase family 2 protein [Candidatus Acidoferrales bacterium]|jgi:GT2 family glycosyltransferase|nr:glycosyltransferase family 2 protein [Candidatus Acidoferrales bacterium]